MDLTLSGDIAKHIITMTKKDNKLAEAMAREYLKTIPEPAIADYLLTQDVVLSLIADRLHKNPELTLRQLQDLAVGKAARAPRGRGPIRRAVKKAAGRKRVRLSGDQVEGLKSKVRSFLGGHPWSNRKQLFAAVRFPSLAVYNRILGELRESRVVQSKGEKSKTVYALFGAKAVAKPQVGKSKGKGKAKPAAAKKAAVKGKGKVKAKAKAKGKGKAKAKAKAVNKKRSQANIRYCPAPGCANRGAPKFGMMCKDHKDLPKAERDKLFAARRAAKAAAAD
jgi:hypothetical protein